MLFCKVRQQDREDMLRKEFEICRSDPNFKLDMKTQRRYYMFLKPEGTVHHITCTNHPFPVY